MKDSDRVCPICNGRISPAYAPKPSVAGSAICHSEGTVDNFVLFDRGEAYWECPNCGHREPRYILPIHLAEEFKVSQF